jgi:hypothetical protein
MWFFYPKIELYKNLIDISYEINDYNEEIIQELLSENKKLKFEVDVLNKEINILKGR